MRDLTFSNVRKCNSITILLDESTDETWLFWYHQQQLKLNHSHKKRKDLVFPFVITMVERSFSLMKLICSRLRARLTQENLSHCMRISKFRSLTEKDYEETLKCWLAAESSYKEYL